MSVREVLDKVLEAHAGGGAVYGGCGRSRDLAAGSRLEKVVEVGRAERIGEGIVAGHDDGLTDDAAGADAPALDAGRHCGQELWVAEGAGDTPIGVRMSTLPGCWRSRRSGALLERLLELWLGDEGFFWVVGSSFDDVCVGFCTWNKLYM